MNAPWLIDIKANVIAASTTSTINTTDKTHSTKARFIITASITAIGDSGGMDGFGPSTDFKSVFKWATTSSDLAPRAFPC